MNFKETEPKYEKESRQKLDKAFSDPNEQQPKKDQYPRVRYGDMDITKVIIKKWRFNKNSERVYVNERNSTTPF